ncbi:MAG: hypothetical protein ACRCY8_05905, partial [Dermatophilaceae bacterium]
ESRTQQETDRPPAAPTTPPVAPMPPVESQQPVETERPADAERPVDADRTRDQDGTKQLDSNGGRTERLPSVFEQFGDDPQPAADPHRLPVSPGRERESDATYHSR